jgi:hypothetical protein
LIEQQLTIVIRGSKEVIDGNNNFVYEKNAGKGITIFVVDNGVNIHVKNVGLTPLSHLFLLD